METLYFVLLCPDIAKIKRYYTIAFGFEEYDHPELKNCIVKFNTAIVLKKSDLNMEEHDRMLYINVKRITRKHKRFATKMESGIYKAVDPAGNIIVIEKLRSKNDYEKLGIIIGRHDMICPALISRLKFKQITRGYQCNVHLSTIIIWFAPYYCRYMLQIPRDYGAALSLMLMIEY